MIFYFSGCGNSRHVAETLAKELDDTLVFIPDAAREGRYDYTLAKGEPLGFVFPVYSWAPPKLVLDFVKQLHLADQPEYVYFACTCGDECGLTEKFFVKALDEKHWPLSAGFSLIMPETYVAMPGFKLDTESKARQKIATADATLMKNIPRLRNQECFSEITVGRFPWLKSKIINPGFNKYALDDRKYHATDECIGCGTCEQACPLHNITLDNGRPVWNGSCTMCMACYHHCPTNAIQYGNATKGKGQYVFS